MAVVPANETWYLGYHFIPTRRRFRTSPPRQGTATETLKTYADLRIQ